MMSHLKALLRCVWHYLIFGGLIQLSLFTSLVSADGDLRPSVDVAQFQDADGNSYIEIYYAIPESGIKYVPTESGKYECQLVLDVEIFLDESLWTNKVWKIEKSIADTSHISKRRHLVDVLRYFIDEPGSYSVSMRVRDMHQADQIDSVRTAFEAKRFASDQIEISDVELAAHIKKMAPGSKSKFVKNKYIVTPSPGCIFGQGSSNIYYYFEAYNLMKHLPDDRYKTICKVIDAQGDEIEGLGITYRTKKKQFDSSIEIGMMNISTLPSGKYKLVYGIADESKATLASRQKPFFVYNPDVAVADKVQGGKYGPLAGLTEEELDKEFEKLIYINTLDDRKFYENLRNADGKREFIYSIWSRPNEAQMSPFLFREQYLARAGYADNQFKSVFSEGWKSDRGRVFILYGVPSNVQRFASTESTIPYQIWTYDKLRGQGGVEFVFADHQGFNKYQLIHSDLRGEIRNTAWKTEVFRGSSERQFR